MRKILPLILSIALGFISCTEKAPVEKDPDVDPNLLELSEKSFSLSSSGCVKTVEVTAGGDWRFEITEDGSGWCHAEASEKQLQINVDANRDATDRSTRIVVYCGESKSIIKISQEGVKVSIVISPTSAKVDYFGGSVVINANTDAELEAESDEDWIEFVKAAKDERTGHYEVTINVKPNVSDSKRDGIVRVKDANSNIYTEFTVSQNPRAEGFIENVAIEDDVASLERVLKGCRNLFTDDLYSALKPEVTQEQIFAIDNNFMRNVAFAMYDGCYDYPFYSFRTQEVQAYRDIQTLKKELKISEYNSYENPLGIYVSEPEYILVFVDELPAYDDLTFKLTLRSWDFDNESTLDYKLTSGLNKIKVGHSGLLYLNYRTEHYREAPAVKVHVAGGTVNGCYHRDIMNNDNWKYMLSNAKSEFIDLTGNCVNLAYKVSLLKKACPSTGQELIEAYDDIISLEWDVMGLYKYGRTPKNHQFGRTVKSGYFMDGTGAGFDNSSIMDPETARTSDCWGIAHEFGHTNQISPGLKWTSTTEVTNNVYSVCARYEFYPEYLNLEMENHSDCEGNTITGARYSAFLNFGIRDGEHWLTQRGPDDDRIYQPGMSRDHFVKLIPLWQMLLYFRYMDSASWYNRDWYGDVAEIVRTWASSNDNVKNAGWYNCEFMKNAMKVLDCDLTDFYVKIGMLAPINESNMNDYSSGPFKIDDAMIQDVLEEGAKHPKPATPCLYYLSYFSKEAYEKQLPLEGTYMEGVTDCTSKKPCCYEIDHQSWKNVAVFEAYNADKEITYISMCSLGNKKNLKTKAIFPSGSVSLYAVGFDGERRLVLGEDLGLENITFTTNL